MSQAGPTGPGTALVTGGARRIGAAIARRLAQEGWSVVIHFRRSKREAEALAGAIVAANGRAAVLRADLADAGEAARLVPDAAALLGPLTLLVNNASMFEDDGIATLDAAHFDRHVAVNLRAPLLLTRDFALQAPMVPTPRSSTSSTSGCCGPIRAASPTR